MESRLHPSVDLTSDIQYHVTVVLVLNVVMSIIAFVGNTVLCTRTLLFIRRPNSCFVLYSNDNNLIDI